MHIVTTTEEIRAATERAASILSDLGHHIEPQPVLTGIEVEEFLPIWQELVAAIPVPDWSLTEPLTRWLGEQGKKLQRKDVSAAITSLTQRILGLFGDADMLLTPTVAVAPFPIGTLKGMQPLDTFRRAAQLGAFTGPFNVSGQPAISVPADRSRAGHPIGVQLAGKGGDDATVLALGRALEERLGWRLHAYE